MVSSGIYINTRLEKSQAVFHTSQKECKVQISGSERRGLQHILTNCRHIEGNIISNEDSIGEGIKVVVEFGLIVIVGSIPRPSIVYTDSDKTERTIT